MPSPMRRSGQGMSVSEEVSRILKAQNAEDVDIDETVTVPLTGRTSDALGRLGIGPRARHADAEGMPVRFSKAAPGLVQFGVPSEENVITWGDSDRLSFGGGPPGFIATIANNSTKQLIHLLRERPTSYNVLVTVDLFDGWTGEGAGWNAVIQYFVGVGQAKTNFLRTIAFPAAPLDFSQVVADVFEIPAQALQVRVAIVGTTDQASAHNTNITALVAPEFE